MADLPDWAIGVISAAGAILLWMIISAILLRTPPLPWTRRNPKMGVQPRRVFHKGGSLIGPENTLMTFRRAALNPLADMLEMDLQVTKDRVIVVSHDEDLLKQSGVSGAIADLNYDELPLLLRSLPLDFPTPTTDHYYMSDEDFERYGLQPYSRFTEVLDALPGVPMHVDCKAKDEWLGETVIQLIKSHRREAITVLGSTFPVNTKYIQNYAKTDDSIVTFAGGTQVLATYLLYYSGLLPLISFPYDVFDTPVPTPQMKKIFNIPILPWLMETPKMWAHLKRRGVYVMGYMMTVPEDLPQARDWGLDGVMTDTPDVFASHEQFP